MFKNANVDQNIPRFKSYKHCPAKMMFDEALSAFCITVAVQCYN